MKDLEGDLSNMFGIDIVQKMEKMLVDELSNSIDKDIIKELNQLIKFMEPHRTKLKIILNPILRKIGFSIVSCFKDGKFIKYQLKKYPMYCEVIKSSE